MEVTIEVSDEEVALEIAYGIIGRANQIHGNPDDQYEHVAEELKEVGDDLREKYE
jgi:hypothetical protein